MRGKETHRMRGRTDPGYLPLISLYPKLFRRMTVLLIHYTNYDNYTRKGKIVYTFVEPLDGMPPSQLCFVSTQVSWWHHVPSASTIWPHRTRPKFWGLNRKLACLVVLRPKLQIRSSSLGRHAISLMSTTCCHGKGAALQAVAVGMRCKQAAMV